MSLEERVVVGDRDRHAAGVDVARAQAEAFIAASDSLVRVNWRQEFMTSTWNAFAVNRIIVIITIHVQILMYDVSKCPYLKLLERFLEW